MLEPTGRVVTDAEGFYAFDAALPLQEPLILVARMDGFKPRSQQVTLLPDTPVRLNFTMEAEPVLVPSVEVLPFEGFLNCQYNLDINGEQNLNSCGGGTDEDQWQFSVGPDLAGVVIEIAWEPNSDLSKFLHATLETQNVSDQTIVLSETTGESVLRLQVAEDFVRKYYPAGGIMRLTVNVDPNNADQEVAVGAAAAVSQSFRAFASLFYVEGPGQGYSVQA